MQILHLSFVIQGVEAGRRLEEGEILAKGPNVFSGYHNRPDKTRSVFTFGGW